jgi:hypothetical protein
LSAKKRAQRAEQIRGIRAGVAFDVRIVVGGTASGVLQQRRLGVCLLAICIMHAR